MKERTMWLVYGAVALLVMAPLLLPGFVLTLDMVFTPHPPLPTEVRSSYLFHAFLHFASYVVPADWLQKLLLLAILVLCGVGAHRLVRSLSHTQKDVVWHRAAYFAGVLYMINPFVYSRFMAGQYAVLLGYALLPFFAMSLINLMTKPSWRSACVTAGWMVAISIVSIHTLGAVAIVGLGIVAAGLWRQRRDKPLLRRVAKWLGATGAMFVVASSYWLVPLVLNQGPIAAQVQRFNDTDREAFATVGGLMVGVVSNVLRLQGFWAETRDQFVLPQSIVPFWGVLGLVVIALAIIGLAWTWRRQRWVAAVFGWSIAAGVIAVLSLSGWLAELFPLLAGYREPHKLVMVVALGYAVLGAYGLAVIIRRLRRPGLAIAPFLLLPLIWTPTMLWGFNGQLRAAHYPQDWYIAQSLLNREPAGKVLFLPWHQYMTFSFAGRIIANPAEQFFGSRIVASHDPEYANLGPDLTYPLSHTVQTEVLPNARHATFGQQLAKHGIHYIMVAKEYDYQQYDYLNKRRDLLTIFDGQVLKLYRFSQKETV